MSDERHDDEILGRALSRAIETQQVHETPYERSRLAVRPARRGFPIWQALGAVAVLVLAVAFGSWFTRPRETPPVAASPTPSESTVHSPAPTATRTPSPTMSFRTVTTNLDQQRVFLVGPAGVPVGVHLDHIGLGNTPDERIASRLRGLLTLPCDKAVPPAGLTCVVPGTSVTLGRVVTQDGLAQVDLVAPGGLNLASESAEWMFIQEVVYTATEEPGISRVSLTVNGKGITTSAGGNVARPLAREDVSGYSFSGPIGKTNGISGGSEGASVDAGLRYVSQMVDGPWARLTFEGVGVDGKPANIPAFSVWMSPATGDMGLGGKYVLTVDLPGVPGGGAGHVAYVSQSPIVSILQAGSSTVIALDDARPWRAYMPDATHLVVEMGGDPHQLSDRIAVWSPTPRDHVARTFHLTGVARVFEANVVWQLIDGTKVVAEGHTTASIGTSSLWGTFDAEIDLPTSIPSGPILPVLRVYEASPKDGTEQGIVAIPLTVR